MATRRSARGIDITVVRPDRHRHYDGIKDLGGKCFGGYFQWQEHCDQAYFLNSHYDWEASAVGVRDGEVLTHWGVWDYRMRIGAARVRTAGIGAVCCHGAYRKRGLMTRTAIAGVNFMRERGYDMSILFGISDFYHRFGYVQSWPTEEIIVATGHLPAQPPEPRPRRFAARPREDLSDLYNREFSRLTGTAVRPTYRKERRPWKGLLWSGSGGKPAGYLLFDEQRGSGRCIEFCGQTDQVLRALGALARRQRWHEVRFPSPHREHPVIQRLLRGFARVETVYQASGGAMVRTVNLRSTLEKMAGELSGRLKASELSGWKGTLLISDSREKAALRIDRGSVDVAEAAAVRHAIRGGDAVAQLLIGTYPPEETVEAGRMRLSGDAKRLVRVLFPAQHPVLNQWDHF